MMLPLTTPEKDEYCELWSHNSGFFEKQGCYRWMAEQLRSLNPQRVLDIGCGGGEGLLSLLSGFSPTIVSLEENARCIEVAAERLQATGYPVEAVYRLGYLQYADGTHDLVGDDEPIPRGAKVTLVHTEFLSDDPPVAQLLAAEKPFDAVTVWLMGAYKLRASCRALTNYKIKSSDEYRIRVENKVHELAHRVLRPGGWLQVVFRGEIPATEKLRQETLASYREQARTTDLEVFGLAYREYKEPTDRGIRMVWSCGGKEVSANSASSAMCSVLLRKPLPTID